MAPQYSAVAGCMRIPTGASPRRAISTATGESDLVWRNRSTGQTALWIMNGLAYTAATGLLSSVDWQPAKVANFNGDTSAGGKPRQDLLWRNSRTGEHVIWLMSGTAIAGGATVLTGAPWWAAP